MSLYFRPEKAVLGDVIPYYDNGVFKPFYLRNYRATGMNSIRTAG